MLHLMIGRAGTGKTTAVKNKIAAYLAEEAGEKRAVLLVPEQSTLQMEKDMTLTFGNAVGRVCEVLSFKRLCHRVFAQTGKLAGLTVDKGAVKLLLGLAVKRVHKKLTVFGRAAESPKFLEDLEEALGEWKSCEVTPAVLAAFAGEAKDEGLKNKLCDLSLLYGAYEELLREGYADPRDDIDRMCERLLESRYLTGKTVYIDGFWSFSPQELRAVGQMLTAAGEVHLTLTLPEGGYPLRYGVFSGPKRTYDALLRLAKSQDVPVETTCLDKIWRFSHEELFALEERLFSYNAGAYEKEAPHITLYTCENIFSEVEYAASQIMRLVREKGYAFSDFTLIARDVGVYGEVLQAVFSRRRIPLFVSQRKSILAKPVLLLVLAALEAAQSRFEGDSFFRLIKTGMYAVSREEGDLLENYAVLWNIRGRRWEKDFVSHPDGFYKNFDEKAERRLAELNSIRKKGIEPLIRLREELVAQEDVKGMCAALYRFLLECGVQGKIRELTDRLQAQGQLDLCAEYGQLWQILMTALDQMALILGGQKMGTGEFKEFLELVLSGYDVSVIPTSCDEVTLGSADRICPPEAKCVILLGVNDGQFPKVEGPGGLLTQKEREKLCEGGVMLLKSAREKLFDEQFLMYSAVTAASEEVIFCCPRADMAGQSQEPSQMVWKLLELFPRLNRVEETEAPLLERVQSKEDILRLAAENYGGREGLIRRDPGYRALYALLEGEESLAPWKESLTEAERRKNAAALSARGQKCLASRAASFSPSQIERFYSCRFSYFMRYILRAKERFPVYVSGAEIGVFVHAVLEDFFDTLRRRKTAPEALSKEERNRLIKEIVAANIEKIFVGLSVTSARFRYLFHRIARLLSVVVDNMVQELASSDFRPVEFEADIGGEGEESASYAITTPEGHTLRIVGKVDKIDGFTKEGRFYIRVVDYKTGNRVFDYTDVLYGLNLQMLVYLFAMCRTGEKRYGKETKPAGVLYLHVHEPVVPLPKTASDEEVAQEVQKVLKMNGLILDDPEIVAAMEHDITGAARFIPVTLSKGGGLGSYAVKENQFRLINDHVEKMIQNMGAALLGGDISIDPYLKGGGKNPCTFCDYRAACLFDPTNGHNRFRRMQRVNRQGFFARIGGEENGGELDKKPKGGH